MTRALVAGSGSIARRHLQLLAEALPEAHLAMAPTRPTTAPPEVVTDVGASWLPSIEAASAWAADLAIIATPAPRHADWVEALAPEVPTLLVEKPLATDLEGADRIADAVDRSRSAVLVGYCLRHSPSLGALKRAIDGGDAGSPLLVHATVGQALDGWRPGTPVHESVTARAALGGGAVLELSHEVDYLSWLFGAPTVLAASIANLGVHRIDCEETADALLGWPDLRGTLHLDLLRRPAERRCTVVGSSGVLTWDALRGEVTSEHADGSLHRLHTDGTDAPDVYERQLAHLLRCAAGDSRPLVTVHDGREALRLSLEVRAAAATSHEGVGRG